MGSGLNCNHLLFSGIDYEALVSIISSKPESIFTRSDIGINVTDDESEHRGATISASVLSIYFIELPTQAG